MQDPTDPHRVTMPELEPNPNPNPNPTPTPTPTPTPNPNPNPNPNCLEVTMRELEIADNWVVKTTPASRLGPR